MFNKKKIAMTMNETIIAVAMIGVISILTLGTIGVVINEKLMDSSKVIFNNEVATAAADMHANLELAGYSDQASFTDAFKKYFELEPVSEADRDKYFASEYKDENGNKISSPFTVKTESGETVNLENKAITSKGVSFAYHYDKNCKPNFQFSQDTSTYKKVGNKYNYIAKNEALSCLVGMYDVNGPKGPNKIGVDVAYLTNFAKDCEGNFIPDVNGSCDKGKAVCTLTDMNCKADGSLKSLDKKSCQCVCKISCPKGFTLDTNTCKCGCDTEKLLKQIGYYGTPQNPNADFEKSKKTCSPVPNNFCGKNSCEANGGIWNKENLTCTCTNRDKEMQGDPYYGLAKGDPYDCCRPKCLYEFKDVSEAQWQSKIAANAGGNQDALKFTLKDTLQNHCTKCKAVADADKDVVTVTKAKNICVQGCTETNPDLEHKDYPFFEFHDINSASNKCRWTCNEKKLKEYADSLDTVTSVFRGAFSQAKDEYPAAWVVGANGVCNGCGTVKDRFNYGDIKYKHFAGFLCSC